MDKDTLQNWHEVVKTSVQQVKFQRNNDAHHVKLICIYEKTENLNQIIKEHNITQLYASQETVDNRAITRIACSLPLLMKSHVDEEKRYIGITKRHVGQRGQRT